ncbi:hypothetical protein EG856_01615 [Mycoplasmopsis phocirhinis]|uniref:Helix-hairpin-helix domain-containing protein n=1 Tax=Mycoplasmopsis phocirhinis TaxID=142650 RepID=A0A4P6MMB1_9BACT|nr:hypothetical protein [Mycoplasmopsis phocirhinis]QBF34618.1 hypothetical protein EG856_01615 [Mycoplasmopsis phocirhinis]
MKKWKLWTLGAVVPMLVLGIGTSLVIDKRESYIKPKQAQTEFKIKIEGAVLNNGYFRAKKGDKLIDIIKLAQPLQNASLKDIEITKPIEKDLNIDIKFDIAKGPFLNWTLLSKTSQLIKYGIKKSIATKLLKHRRVNSKTTWTNISELKGIGPQTLKKLKQILIV